MITSTTFVANIYVGLQEGYGDILHTIYEAEIICQEYCNYEGYCVTVTPTQFIYAGGQEEGCIVGLIQYPRFPKEENEIRDIAIHLAKIFIKRLGQLRVSVVCSDKTYLIEAKT